MSSVVRLTACLAFAVSTACLIGCGSSEATSPVLAVDQHAHAHESHEANHGRTASGPLAEALVRVERLASTIQAAFKAGDPEQGHGPLHEIGHLLEELPPAAAKESLTSAQQQQLKEAVDSLMDSFGALDEQLHGVSNEGKSFDDVAADIEVALARLKSVREEEHSP